MTEIVESTSRTATVGDRAWRDLLDRHDAIVRAELDRHRGKKVNAIGLGDGVLATFDGPARACRCACALHESIRSSLGIDIRTGLHTGEIELRGDDVTGMAVNIAARVMGLANANETLVSRTVTDLVAGSGLEFADKGEHELKGVPGKWAIYSVRTYESPVSEWRMLRYPYPVQSGVSYNSPRSRCGIKPFSSTSVTAPGLIS
jgi:class 3 adenylate cyclase